MMNDKNLQNVSMKNTVKKRPMITYFMPCMPSGTTHISLQENMNKLFIILTKKEKNVLERRFGLKYKNSETLEKIGKRYHVSRERIRQIQDEAIKKLKKHVINTPINEIIQLGEKFIHDAHGIIEEKKLFDMMKKCLPLNPNEHYIRMSLELDQEIEYASNTEDFYPHWKLKSIKTPMIRDIKKTYQVFMEKEQKLVDLETLHKACKKIFARMPEYTIDFLSPLLSIDKHIKIRDGKYSLVQWRHINPHTVYEKILCILREEKKPMHFRKITKKIKAKKIDEKKIHDEAVHNELIRKRDFVLIGRGTYALAEWGYIPGKMTEVIESILKREQRPLTKKEIINAVKKERRVKNMTVLMNLRRKEQFERIGRDKYQLNYSYVQK